MGTLVISAGPPPLPGDLLADALEALKMLLDQLVLLIQLAPDLVIHASRLGKHHEVLLPLLLRVGTPPWPPSCPCPLLLCLLLVLCQSLRSKQDAALLPGTLAFQHSGVHCRSPCRRTFVVRVICIDCISPGRPPRRLRLPDRLRQS